MQQNDLTLHAPLILPLNLKEIDGRKIVSTTDYQMLINLNLTLVTYNKDTNLETLLAEDFEVQDKTIVFHIKKGVKTISGHEIKALDAEVSLKRIIAAKASHSRLTELLCSDMKLNECSNISSKDYELKLIAQKKSYIPLILGLLASADNVILPLTALDSKSPESNIINFKETSGPYYINQDTIEDKKLTSLELTINPSHFLYKKNLATKVKYTVINEEELTKENKLNFNFNYVHNVLGIRKEKIDLLNNPDSNLNFFNTLPLRNSMIFTTEHGRSRLTADELIFHELYIKSALLKFPESYPNIRQLQIEYFPAGSAGSLRSEQLSILTKKYESLSTFKPKVQTFTLGLYPGNFKKFGHLFINNKNITLVELTDESLIDSVDFYLDSVDSSVEESLDGLEYNKNFGIFKISNDEMKTFIDAESKEERINLLQNIHLNSLINGYILNLGSSPYVTILSKDWHAEPSTVQVGFPVWMITKKN